MNVANDLHLSLRSLFEHRGSALRWSPSAPSESALAMKAQDECPEAEAYNERVKVVGGHLNLIWL